MRTLAKFDSTHPRCIFPRYGRIFSDAMQAQGLTPQQIATALGISVENVLGYRRGFQRNRPNLTPKLESLLGATLPFDELRPSEKAKAAAAAPSHEIKRQIGLHLKAIGDLVTKLPEAA